MKKLITYESPQALIDAYLKNPTFNALVNKHEAANSDYQSMLEEAVSLLSLQLAEKNELVIRYSRKFGVIDSA